MRGRVGEEGMRRGRDEERRSGEKGVKRRGGELEWRRGAERRGGEKERGRGAQGEQRRPRRGGERKR